MTNPLKEARELFALIKSQDDYGRIDINMAKLDDLLIEAGAVDGDGKIKYELLYEDGSKTRDEVVGELEQAEKASYKQLAMGFYDMVVNGQYGSDYELHLQFIDEFLEKAGEVNSKGEIQYSALDPSKSNEEVLQAIEDAKGISYLNAAKEVYADIKAVNPGEDISTALRIMDDYLEKAGEVTSDGKPDYSKLDDKPLEQIQHDLDEAVSKNWIKAAQEYYGAIKEGADFYPGIGTEKIDIDFYRNRIDEFLEYAGHPGEYELLVNTRPATSRYQHPVAMSREDVEKDLNQWVELQQSCRSADTNLYDVCEAVIQNGLPFDLKKAILSIFTK